MKQQTYASNMVPTANLAVNKSRIKVYKNAGNLPTYFLQKSSEFQIELFNPTTDTVLAKIYLNENLISQGGLVLRPGQRVFLDRYLDVAKKFVFDTYKVSNTNEVKKAIENNGDMKVEFYKEAEIKRPYIKLTDNFGKCWYDFQPYCRKTDNFINNYNMSTSNTRDIGNTYFNTTSTQIDDNEVVMNSLSFSSEVTSPIEPINKLKRKRSKLIETGRVEMGSKSNQEFDYVDKSFDYIAFHTVEYKILPVSQKINTVDDIQVKVYCVKCGSKLSKTDRFCSTCGRKR